MVASEIFKAYDVRGLYGEQIDGDVAEAVGRAFARVIGSLSNKPVDQLRLGLGRDMRLTAPELAARYRDGMVSEGAHVLDAGMVGTEMLYFLVGSRDLDGGLMCTASHNPKQYTGAKMVERGALALSGDRGLQDIRRLIDAGLPDVGRGPIGSVEEVDVAPEFRAAALALIDPAAVEHTKVVVDGGNGMAGVMVGPILDQLDLDLASFYWEPDGEFPDHEPNPLLPENRRFIMDKVVETGADLGIAWDGDADRCFFIDDRGRFVDGDFLTALLAQSVLEKQPGAHILYDVRASRAVPDTVRAHGGTPHINRVGHAFFKSRMRDEGGAFGGEVSGHYYFAEFYNADSGTIPALLILELLSKRNRRLSELIDTFRSRYFISGEINSEVPDSDAKMAALEERYGDGRDHEARRGQRRLRRLALQRARLQHRAAAAAQPRIARLRAAHGGEARRGARDHPRLIHRLPIPTPWAVGRVNCYLVDDDPLTLVDTGPNSGHALDSLEQALAGHGRRVEDLERIVVTHHHPDHEGLLGILKRRSGAEVCALARMEPWLRDWRGAMKDEDQHAAALMRRHGVDDDMVALLEALSQGFRAWGSSAPVDRMLDDGGTLAFAGRTWHIHHRPGHSSTDTLFHDRQRREAIGGDHLLLRISSNPLASKDQPQALVSYLRSLRATQAMEDLETVHPGHGDTVTDPRGLIDSRFAMHDRRARKIATMLDGGPATAHAIARRMFGKAAITQAFLTISEVLGHLDLLVERGDVVALDEDGLTRFARA